MMHDKVASAILYKFCSPSGVYPGFLLPLFQRWPGSNEVLVQVLNEHDDVIAFREIDVDNVPLIDPDNLGRDVAVRLGDKGLWAFAFESQSPIYGTKEQIAPSLHSGCLRIANRPMVQLQVFKYLGSQQELRKAYLSAYDYLSGSSPSLASNWLNYTVYPEIMRKAIWHAHADLKRSSIAHAVASCTIFAAERYLYVQADGATAKFFRGDKRDIIAGHFYQECSACGIPAPKVVMAERKKKRRSDVGHRSSTPKEDDRTPDQILAASIEMFERRFFPNAEALAMRALNQFEAADLIIPIGLTHLHLGNILRAQAKNEAARNAIDQARRIFLKEGRLEYGPLVSIAAAKVHLNMGNTEQAISLLMNDVIRSGIKVEDAVKIEAFQILAEEQMRLYRYDEALEILRGDLLPLLEIAGSPAEIAIAQGQISVCLIHLGNTDSDLVRISTIR